MKVVYGIGCLKKNSRKPKVVAVGVFDGVHRGHRLILRQVVREAKRRRLASAVVTFAFHPTHIFNPSQKVPALTSLEHKCELIGAEGIDLCCVINFNKAFASIAPERFIRDILLKKIGMISLYVGEDFVFGKGAQGNVRLLKEFSRKFSFSLHVLKHLKVHNRVVSSTLIRRLVRSGNLPLAEALLGRRVSFSGQVVKGEGRGRSLDFPTANLKPHHEVLVPDGIYATEALLGGRIFKSATYIGTKPTFRKKEGARSIEVFIFGFAQDLYGRDIEVRLVKKIRNDRRFPSSRHLIARIKKDVAIAKKILR